MVEGTLVVPGTAGDDTLDVIRGEVLTVKLDGVLIYQGTGVDTVTFDGGAGYDVVNVTGWPTTKRPWSTRTFDVHRDGCPDFGDEYRESRRRGGRWQ